jgi:prepilin-type N-terminal cleavage/methylation domain-containing protein
MKSSHYSLLRRANSTRGFSLVELLGVIILIGVISLGAYIYVGNASNQAITNTKARNAQMLNQLVSISAATGATIATGATNNIDTTSNLTAIASLNAGFTVNGIPIKMNPPIVTPASYPMSGTPPNISFTYNAATTALP